MLGINRVQTFIIGYSLNLGIGIVLLNESTMRPNSILFTLIRPNTIKSNQDPCAVKLW